MRTREQKRERKKRKEGERNGERKDVKGRKKGRKKKVASKQQGQTKSKCYKQIMYLDTMHCRCLSVIINLLKLLMFLPMLH